MQQQNLPVPRKPEPLADRTIEVARVYLHKGGMATHEIWMSVGPSRTWLKILMAPFLVIATMATFLFIMGVVFFALLVLFLMWSISRLKQRKHTTYGA